MRKKSYSVLSVALLLAGCGPSANERLADRVTKAIIANDMHPVEKDFNAIVRPKLQNRAMVGRLSDELLALGAFKGIHEQAPSSAAGGKHVFDVTFEKGKWVEDMTIDQDGKIAAFHIHRPNQMQAGSAEMSN